MARRVAINNLSTTSASDAAKARLPTWVRESTTVTVTQSTPSNIYTNQITVSISFPAASAAPTNFISAATANRTLQVATTMKQEPSL